MHVPIEGVYPAAEKIEDRSRIGCHVNQNNTAAVDNGALDFSEQWFTKVF